VLVCSANDGKTVGEIVLEGPGLSIDEPIQRVLWRGAALACQFVVGFPTDAEGQTFNLNVARWSSDREAGIFNARHTAGVT
jgi:hypothetical protein